MVAGRSVFEDGVIWGYKKLNLVVLMQVDGGFLVSGIIEHSTI